MLWHPIPPISPHFPPIFPHFPPFSPISPHFPPFSPISPIFPIFLWPKKDLETPGWETSKACYWTLLTHLGTHLFELAACSLPQPSGPRYWGLGVRLGNSEGWKPQKVGGCGWSRCPRNRILSHVAQDMAYSWFVAVGIWSFWGPFWAVSGTYHGVRGRQRAC